jgi:hypothetical protein
VGNRNGALGIVGMGFASNKIRSEETVDADTSSKPVIAVMRRI